MLFANVLKRMRRLSKRQDVLASQGAITSKDDPYWALRYPLEDDIPARIPEGAVIHECNVLWARTAADVVEWTQRYMAQRHMTVADVARVEEIVNHGRGTQCDMEAVCVSLGIRLVHFPSRE